MTAAGYNGKLLMLVKAHELGVMNTGYHSSNSSSKADRLRTAVPDNTRVLLDTSEPCACSALAADVACLHR
jgi:hypothetical protein